MSLTRSYRYNLKLPLEMKSLFQAPYQDFVKYLLTYQHQISEDKPFVERGLDEIAYWKGNRSEEGCKRKVWTIWLGPELRDEFLEAKNLTMSHSNHDEFIYVLLQFHKRSVHPELSDGNVDCEDSISETFMDVDASSPVEPISHEPRKYINHADNDEIIQLAPIINPKYIAQKPNMMDIRSLISY
jgi:hypothetical protein